MNFLPRLSRVIVAATLMAGSPGAAYAAAALAPALPNKAGTAIPAAAAKVPAQNILSTVPLFFEENKGQADASVKFSARAANYNLHLTATEAVMVLPAQKHSATQAPVVVRMKLKGANARPAVRGLNQLPGHTSYMFGSDQSKWQIGVAQYAKVKFSSVYPGIDVVYYSNKGNVEHDFIVAPGANPGRILMGFEGAKSLRLDARGNLILNVVGGDVTFQAPTLYQMAGGKRVPVQGRFMLAGDKHVRFVVGSYLRNKTLVIDPQIMYGTYLGGTVNDSITAIAVDASKQAYVTGWARSASNSGGFSAPTNTFPAVIGANRGGADAFVAKISADGSTLMWLAWLGGALDDQAKGIALEKTLSATPKVYITGVTASAGLGTSFPVAGPAMQTCDVNTGSLTFVSELTQPANIPALVYSTCWGGVQGVLTNTGNAIAVDAAGAAYVTGTTFATNFPMVGGAVAPYNTMGAASEAGFVYKVNPAGAGGVAYSMYLGPSTVVTNSNAIAVDALGQAWVAGKTTSDAWPAAALAGHFAETRTAGVWADAFVAKVKADGTSLLYATYINGNTEDEATAIALNNNGDAPYNVFVAGWTVSSTDFPSTVYYNQPISVRPTVYQKDPQGADDAFILKLNPAALDADRSLEMVYATRVGAASGAERALGLALDSNGDAYIAGWTQSANWAVAGNDTLADCSAPCVSRNVAGAVETNTTTDQAAFVAAIGPTGLTRPFFSYLGGSPGTFGQQIAHAIAIDSLQNIYVAGITPSNTFPATTGSLMDGSAGVELLNATGTENATDGFIVKIAPVLAFGAPAAACTLSVDPNSGFMVGGTSVTITGTGFTGLTGTSAVSFGGTDALSYSVNASSTVIIAKVPPRGSLAAVALVVTNSVGTCQTNYSYVASPGTGASCGADDFFFPSPATGARGTFSYCMAQPGTVRIRVYNTIGDLATKVEDVKAAGAQLSTVNTNRLASGVYLYIMEKDYGNGTVDRARVKKFVVKH